MMPRNRNCSTIVAIVYIALYASPIAAAEPAAPAKEPVYYGRTAAEWIRLSVAGNDTEREVAVDALKSLCPESPDAVLALARATKDLNSKVGDAAAYAIEELGARAKSATAILATGLSDRAISVRGRSIRALDAIGWNDEAVAALAAAIDDRDLDVSRDAAHQARELGEKAKGAASALTRALNSSNAETAYVAAMALVKASGEHEKAIPILLAGARKPLWTTFGVNTAARNTSLRQISGADVAEALAKARPISPTMIEVYSSLLNTESTQWKAMHKAQFGEVEELTSGGYAMFISRLRRSAAEGLSNAGSRGLPGLEKGLRSNDGEIVVLSAKAIGAMGTTADRCVDSLIGILDKRQDGSDSTLETSQKATAALALGQFGQKAKKAAPKLEQIVMGQAEKPCDRIAAARSLWRIEKSSKGLPVAINALSPKWTTRDDWSWDEACVGLAADLIVDMGATAKSTEGDLKSAATTDSGININGVRKVHAAYAWYRVSKRPEALDCLVGCLDSKWNSEAVERLRQLGPDARPVAATLVRYLKETKPAMSNFPESATGYRADVRQALRAIDPESAKEFD